MAQLGTKKRSARVRVQTKEEASAIIALGNEKKWEVMVGIEPDKKEDISDIEKLRNQTPVKNIFNVTARNAPCPCRSGKQYKRCFGK